MTDNLIWITGASSGIGRALADTVPFDAARIIDISRRGGAPGTEHLAADLADPAAWAAVEEHLLVQLGNFTGRRAVFIHNAGTIDPIGFAGEVDSPAYRAAVLLNAAAPQALGHAFLRAVRTADCEGVLLMLTSGAASNPYAGWSHYSAGKAAIDAWVRAAGEEQTLREGGCRVLAVAPGVVATPMQQRIRTVDPHDFPRVGRFHELHESGQLRDPEDAAKGLWRLVDRPVESGSVVDLRKL